VGVAEGSDIEILAGAELGARFKASGIRRF